MTLMTLVSVGDQPGLELVDRGVAALQLGLVGISADLVDQHVLVVRPVEDADVAGARQLLLDAPEEVVGALLLGGRLERVVLDALRVDHAHHVAHDAALARGVHGLQDEQDLRRGAGARGGEEPFLQLVEHPAGFLQVRGGAELVAGVAGGRLADRRRPA